MANYKMIVYANRFGEDIEYVAEYPALKGVIGIGTCDEEAISDLKTNAEAHLQVMLEQGFMIPEPDLFDMENEYSGKLSLRISKSLHRRMVERSKNEGVSLNQFMVEGLSAYAYRDRESDERITKSGLKLSIGKKT
jgi:antitoxin HicB